jgi:NitT/TauT family transport system permease protein
MSPARSLNLLVAQWLFLVLIVAGWEFAARSGGINTALISSPSLIASKFWASLTSGELLHHTWITVAEAFTGLVAGTLAGVALGLIFGSSRVLGPFIEPFVMAINSLPRVALAPLIVMYVGIGFASKFFLAFSLVVVPMMINTYEGVRSVDALLVRVMRTFGASRAQMFLKLLLPNCIPWIVSALRLSIAFAIIGAIVGEFISSREGIGYMIDVAAGGFDTTGMIMPLFVLMILSVSLDRLFAAVGQRLLHWRESEALDATV